MWKKTGNLKYRLVGLVPLLVSLGGAAGFDVAFLKTRFGAADSNGFLYGVGETLRSLGVSAETWNDFRNFLPLVVFVLAAACVVMSFFILFDELGKASECAFLFLLALASAVVMGFSPTIYVSGARASFFFYGLVILLLLKLIEWLPIRFSCGDVKLAKRLASVLCAGVAAFNMACIFALRS